MTATIYLPALSEPSLVNEAERTLSVVITSRRRDRDGDVIEPAGLDFTEYMKNPVVLWAHALDLPPVGRVVSVTADDERAVATVQFADTPQGLELFELYRRRYLNGWSIGFLPKVTEPLSGTDGRGLRICSAEVVEISAVPVPSNPDALTRALATRHVTAPTGGDGAVRPASAGVPTRRHTAGMAVDAAWTKACLRMRDIIRRAVRDARGELSAADA